MLRWLAILRRFMVFLPMSSNHTLSCRPLLFHQLLYRYSRHRNISIQGGLHTTSVPFKERTTVFLRLVRMPSFVAVTVNSSMNLFYLSANLLYSLANLIILFIRFPITRASTSPLKSTITIRWNDCPPTPTSSHSFFLAPSNFLFCWIFFFSWHCGLFAHIAHANNNHHMHVLHPLTSSFTTQSTHNHDSTHPLNLCHSAWITFSFCLIFFAPSLTSTIATTNNHQMHVFSLTLCCTLHCIHFLRRFDITSALKPLRKNIKNKIKK